MYPDLSYIVEAVIGVGPDNALSIVKTFGLFLIFSFLTSAYFFRLELIRKEKEGLLKSSKEVIVTGEKPTIQEILFNALIGFILLYKLGYAIGHFDEFQSDTAGVILSKLGSLPAGITGAVLFGGWKYWNGNKKALDKPVKKTVTVSPYQRVGDITIVAAISGIVGAKLAAMFESKRHIEAFLEDPIGQLLSGSGLAIYGGLILAFVVVRWYVKKKGMTPIHVMDAVAPALMAGYGVGRMGCQFSGDGDWGIVNTAPTPSWWFLPDWMWAYDYPHNVLHEGVRIADCTWNYCNRLAEPVYPTPVYETIVAFAIVALLWALRKQIKIAGMLFFIYVTLTAIERYFIEKIRVNPDIEFLGMQATQAEYISMTLFLAGIGGMIWAYRNKDNLAFK